MVTKLKIRRRYLYNILAKSVPVAGDLFAVYFAFALAYYMRFHNAVTVKVFPVLKGVPSWEVYNETFIVISFAFVVIFVFTGLYREVFLNGFEEAVQTVKSVTLATVIIVAVTFLYRGFEYSRLVITFAWLFAMIFVFVFHNILRHANNFFLYRYFGPKRIYVLGGGKTTEVIKRHYKDDFRHKVYYVDKLQEMSELAEFCRVKKIDELIITNLNVRHLELSEITNVCDDLAVDLRIVPDLLEMRMGELIIDSSFGLPLLRIKPVSLYGQNMIIKRLFDVAVSLVFLGFFMFPLMLVILFIKLESPGGMLYMHKRVGYKGGMFPFFKFRSMIQDADKQLEKLKRLSERTGPVFKMKRDPRVTFFGKLLRRLSLDELPQFINVLRGDMSIIGPRPQVVWEAEAYDEYARKRLNVLPGITGLWQVSGRASLSYEDMIRLDIFYIENWSFGLDLEILLKTLPTILIGKGAY